MISLNSTVFSIPGLILGLLLSALINVALREVIFLQASNWLSYDLTETALILGVTCGVVVPLLANYLPISAALSQTLRSSLDLSKRTNDQVGVKVQKLEDVGMSFN